MRKTILISIISLILISCQNGKMKIGNNVNSGIISDTIQFPLRILPDNGWFLKLYPNSEFEYIYFSGFSSGNEILERGNYKLVDKQIIFMTENEKSEFNSMKYYISENNKNGIKNGKCINDKTEKYCLIVENE